MLFFPIPQPGLGRAPQGHCLSQGSGLAPQGLLPHLQVFLQALHKSLFQTDFLSLLPHVFTAWGTDAVHVVVSMS